MEASGRRNAAFIMLAKIIGSDLTKAAASGGFVDQTRDETVGDRGRKAMGPVGRNLWYAVVFGAWKAVRGGCKRVATIAWVSYAQP
jgi:hypothetical protein